MNDPRETLARIREQADNATPGPWEWEDEKALITGGGSRAVVLEAYGYDEAGLDVGDPADAKLIASSRTIIPALLDALEKVLRLHPRVVVLHADPEFGRMEDDAICGTCIVNHEPADWPCPNVTAITTALNGETA